MDGVVIPSVLLVLLVLLGVVALLTLGAEGTTVGADSDVSVDAALDMGTLSEVITVAAPLPVAATYFAQLFPPQEMP